MKGLDKTYLFRMLHINNVPHLMRFGFTHKTSPDANPDFVPIGDSSIINTRNRVVLFNGRSIGDYIPFYFGVRMPMLLVIQKGFNNVKVISAEDIVYCVTSVQKILDSELEFIFTDGHANNKFTTQYGPERVNEIPTLVDLDAAMEKYWNSEEDLDLKRRKEAEFLVLGYIPFNAVQGFIVYNQTAKNKLVKMGIGDNMIIIKSNYYF